MGFFARGFGGVFNILRMMLSRFRSASSESISSSEGGVMDLPSMVIDPAHYSAIGRVAAEWSDLENTLNDIIIDFAQMPYTTGVIVTQNLNKALRIKLIQTFCNYYFPKEVHEKEFNKLATEEIDAVYDRRNLYVHSLWYETDNDNNAVGQEIRAKGKFSSQIMSVPIPRMEMDADAIITVHTKLQNWQSRVFSPDRSKRPNGGGPLPSQRK